MLRNIRNFWLFCLPVAIYISWQLREPPKLISLDVKKTVVTTNDKNSFYPLEDTLRNAYRLNQHGLMIDAQTEKYLSQAVSVMNVNYDDDLLEKTFPSAAGLQLLNLFKCYTSYKKEESQISKHYMEVLQENQMLDYRNLQDAFLGESSNKLFMEHHRFYENSEAAGVQLVTAEITSISVPSLCLENNNVK